MSLRALTPIDTHRLQQLLRRLVCSAPWFDRCWSAFNNGDDRRARPTKRPDDALDRAAIYPPGGRRRTAMKRCIACGSRWYPPQYVRTRSGLCEDCVAARQLPDGPPTDERTHVPSTQSPTAVAMRQLGYYRIRLIELPLAAEDEASLRREIAASRASNASVGHAKNPHY
jgi:hypothetical protein